MPLSVVLSHPQHRFHDAVQLVDCTLRHTATYHGRLPVSSSCLPPTFVGLAGKCSHLLRAPRTEQSPRTNAHHCESAAKFCGWVWRFDIVYLPPPKNQGRKFEQKEQSYVFPLTFTHLPCFLSLAHPAAFLTTTGQPEGRRHRVWGRGQINRQ